MAFRPQFPERRASFVDGLLLGAALLGLVALLLIPTSIAGGTASSTASRSIGVPSAGVHVAARPASGPAPRNPQTWTDVTNIAGTPPGARWLGAMTYDPADQYVLLFGGYGPQSSGGALAPYGDTWAFANGQWSSLGATGPAPRYGASIAWDAADGYAVLFGGYTTGSSAGTYAFNDTWTYVHGTWTNITGTTNQSPPASWRQSESYDAGDGYVVMFGGTNALGTTTYSTTWEFLAGKWTKLTVSGSPPGRFRASMAYDPRDNYSVLFGGCTTTCPDSTTWKYHNLTWTALSPASHPSARVYFGITYSPIAQSVLLFGGTTSATSNTPVSDTWNFTNGSWTSLTSSLSKSPTAVAYLMMAFDPTDNYTIMFGGEWSNATYSNRTWVLGPSIIGKLAIAPAAIDLHQSTTINATPVGFSGYVSYTYAQLPSGCVGSNVSSLTCVPNATGTFPVAVQLNDSLKVPAWENGSIAVNPDPAVATYVVDHSSVTAGSRATLNVTTSGGTLPYSYRYSGLPSGCGSINTASLPCVPTGTGVFPVQVQVTDAAHYSAFSNLTLTVNPKPNVTALLVLPLQLDVGQLLTIRATVAGGTAPLTYLYTGLPTGCASVNASVLTCTPTTMFNSLVTVNAFDAFGWAANASTALVVNSDPHLAATAASPGAFDAGTTVHLWANASGGTGTLTYQYLNTPVGCTPAASSSTSCVPEGTGNASITVRVTDAAGFVVNGTIAFTVNAPVTLSGLTPASPQVDLGQNLTVTAVPTAGTAPFTFSFHGLPSPCATLSTTGVVSCFPRASGHFSVTVTVTDASQQTGSVTASVTVFADPVVSGINVTASPPTVGATFQLQANHTGGSGGFHYAWSGLPSGCAGQNASTISCTPTSTGTFDVQVQVTDSLGKSATGSMNVTVQAKPSSGILGLSSTTFYGLVGGVILVVVIAAVALLMLRRRGPRSSAPASKAKPPADDWSEGDTEPPT